MSANVKNMKKAVGLVALALAIFLTSCSVYTCPTYSKTVQKKAVKEIRM
jgi:PBP1b-binding outer membrane lipoprotein LpoB